MVYFARSLGASHTSDAAKARASIDSLAAIRANGKYKEINDKYFKFDVYGAES